MNETKAQQYVASIRNPTKKAYASAYLAYMLCQRGPVGTPKNLSYMAAQAVRMRLGECRS